MFVRPFEFGPLDSQVVLEDGRELEVAVPEGCCPGSALRQKLLQRGCCGLESQVAQHQEYGPIFLFLIQFYTT